MEESSYPHCNLTFDFATLIFVLQYRQFRNMPTVGIIIATIVFFRIKNGDQLFEANPHFYVYRMI